MRFAPFESWGCYLRIDLCQGTVLCGIAVTRLRVHDSRGRQRRRGSPFKDSLASPQSHSRCRFELSLSAVP